MRRSKTSAGTRKFKPSWTLPTDMAPRIRVGGKEKCPDPFGRAFAARLDGPLLRCGVCPRPRASETVGRPTFEYAPPTDQKKVGLPFPSHYHAPPPVSTACSEQRTCSALSA